MNANVKARILLVDDEEDFLQTLAERLKFRGLQVHTAPSGEDAVSRVEQQKYDAIIVDLSMPGIDGIETTERIKAISPTSEIIILTGHGSIGNGVQAIKHGASDFLQKPVEINVLLEKIGEAKNKRMLVLQKESQAELDHILKIRGW